MQRNLSSLDTAVTKLIRTFVSRKQCCESRGYSYCLPIRKASLNCATNRRALLKLAFHDADTDTDIIADTSDTCDFLKLFLCQAERHADILATILARMSAKMSVSVSVSASWNASFSFAT